MTLKQRLRRAMHDGVIRPGVLTEVLVEHKQGCHVWTTNCCTCEPALKVRNGSELADLDDRASPRKTSRTDE